MTRIPTPRRGRLAATVVALAVLAAPAAAPAAEGPVVGAWATYRWTSSLDTQRPVLIRQPGTGGEGVWSVTQEPAAPPPIFVTYGIVRADARSYVLQILTRLTEEGAPLSVTQVTVDRRSGKALRSIIRRPSGVIATPENGLRPFRAGTLRGSEEAVAVPAGRFSAIRAPYRGGTVWVSDQVPAMGLVKAEFATGRLELVRSGPAGAEDLLRS